jgi:hypothetical protein
VRNSTAAIKWGIRALDHLTDDKIIIKYGWIWQAPRL